jgi:hypothetical protein
MFILMILSEVIRKDAGVPAPFPGSPLGRHQQSLPLLPSSYSPLHLKIKFFMINTSHVFSHSYSFVVFYILII